MARIFKQFGHGYGTTTVNIVAQIDGNTVYSGGISTADSPVPGSWAPGPDPNVECFSWTEPTNNVTTRSLTIEVTNGMLQLGQTLAQGNLANLAEYTNIYSANIDGQDYGDPLTNVAIDGVLLTRPTDELPGQWNWDISSGSTFTAIINCNIPMSGNV